MTPNTKFHDRFEYHTEDINCCDCLYLKLKSERENKNNGCGEEICRFDDIRRDAIANGRLTRPKGWNKWHG